MPLDTERDGHVLIVRLDNPPRHFQDQPLIHELFRVVTEVERDRSIGAVVITGAAPDTFLTHYDVTEILDFAEITPDVPSWLFGIALRVANGISRLPGGPRLLDNRRTSGLLGMRRLHQSYVRMNRMDKVFIAAVNGHATAAGCEVALACDIRLMADGDFMFGLTEPLLGFNPGGGGGQRLVRAVGPSRAVEMLLEGRHLSPRDAQEIGLVHRVVEPSALLDQALVTAHRLARRSPRAVWASKRAAYRGFSSRWPAGFQLDRTGFMWSAVAPSTQRAMRVMLEQMEDLPDGVLSPWHQAETLRGWQEGTASSFER